MNILVSFSNANNCFVKNKLRIGALIVSLGTITASCHTLHQPKCYDVVPTGGKDTISKNDTIVKIQPVKPDSIRVTCYEMVAPDKNQEKK
jgi:hypothetical protein